MASRRLRENLDDEHRIGQRLAPAHVAAHDGEVGLVVAIVVAGQTDAILDPDATRRPEPAVEHARHIAGDRAAAR